MQHPNTIPVFVENCADINLVGKEMMKAADNVPVQNKPQYSKNEEEVVERAKQIILEEKEKYLTLSRVLVFDRQFFVSLVLTKEIYEGQKPCYRLSMVQGLGPLNAEQPFGKVPDYIAKVISEQIFGSTAVIAENPTGLTRASHFIKYIEE